MQNRAIIVANPSTSGKGAGAESPSAARGAMAKLIIQLMNEEWTVDLQVGSNILGRASNCTIPLKDASLSRQHCDIVYVSGQATLIDKGSLNGTLVNGRKVSEQKLAPGDKIVIGASTLWYERKNVAAEKKPEPSAIKPASEVRKPAASADSGVATRRALNAVAAERAPSTRSSAPQTATPPPAPAADVGRADERLKDF